MKLERLGDITSELSSNLVKSIFLPGGLLDWLSKPLAGLRERAKGGSRAAEAADPAKPVVAMGPTVLLGGAPVPDEAIVAILHLAGGRGARVAVIPLDGTDEARTAAGEAGMRLFTRFGMRKVELLEIYTRERADSPEWATKLASYDAVLLCGAGLTNGLQVFAGTACARTLKELQTAGKPIAGLGAGAKLLADRVICTQDGAQAVCDGLGLVPGLMIEADFTQQSRFSPMFRALSENAQGLMGMGLDAGASAVIHDGETKIFGDTSVTFMDPREAAATGDSANCCGLKVHVLLDGYTMNLRTRKPSGPPKESTQAAGSDR